MNWNTNEFRLTVVNTEELYKEMLEGSTAQELYDVYQEACFEHLDPKEINIKKLNECFLEIRSQEAWK
jgi:hypothetical protein